VDTALEIEVAGVRKRLDTQGERPKSEGEEYDDETIGKDPGVETVLCKLGSQRVSLAKSYALRIKEGDSAACPTSSPTGKGNTECVGLRMAESQCSAACCYEECSLRTIVRKGAELVFEPHCRIVSGILFVSLCLVPSRARDDIVGRQLEAR
jgi:hypothetical protein